MKGISFKSLATKYGFCYHSIEYREHQDDLEFKYLAFNDMPKKYRKAAGIIVIDKPNMSLVGQNAHSIYKDKESQNLAINKNENKKRNDNSIQSDPNSEKRRKWKSRMFNKEDECYSLHYTETCHNDLSKSHLVIKNPNQEIQLLTVPFEYEIDSIINQVHQIILRN